MKRSLESASKLENLFMCLNLSHLGPTVIRLKLPLRGRCYFTAQHLHLDQHLRVRKRVKFRHYQVTSLLNSLIRMLMTLCLEKEGQNAPIRRHRVSLSLRGSKKARRDLSDRYCLILTRDVCLIIRAMTTPATVGQFLLDPELYKALVLLHA